MPLDLSQVVIVLGGVVATPLGRLGSLHISDVLNDAPNTATLTTKFLGEDTVIFAAPFNPDAFDNAAFCTTPTAGPPLPAVHPGMPIAIYLGQVNPDYLIFGGELFVLEQFYELIPEHVAFHVSCLDYTRRGNRKKVLRTYGQQSATAIVLDLVSRYTDLTSAHVAAGLPTVEGGITFTFEDLSRALSRVAETIGASWYWDYTGDLHFFLTEPEDAPDDLTPTARFADLKITSDITQVRTRVLVEGAGSTVAATLAAGETIIPVRDATAFAAAGGQAISGTLRLTYTGKQAGTGKANTVGTPTAPPARPGTPSSAYSSTPGGLGAGPYYWVVQFEMSDGARSDITQIPQGPIWPGTYTAIDLSMISIGPAGTARRRIFRTKSGGSEYREVTAIQNNTATTFTDTEADSTLGGAPQAPQGGAAPPTAIGATTLQVSDLTPFSASGGWVLAGEQPIRYTGTSSTGGFFLTGIPASGPGSITATIPVGDPIVAAPALVGVAPLTGTDPLALAVDADIQLLAVVDDAAAQSALAALEGGDGIVEHYIQDRRLSEAGARARGLAELALFKQVEVRISYLTYDEKTRSGKTVHVDLPAPTDLTGDFLIQQVTIDQVSFAKNFMPRRRVEASSTRFTFDQVLQRLLLEGL
jgi:hypothetical protein